MRTRHHAGARRPRERAGSPLSAENGKGARLQRWASRRLIPFACAAGLGACGPDDNHPPVLDAVGSQIAAVERELTLTLRASDPDGDPLAFDITADSPAIDQRVALTKASSTSAVLRWTPIASDMGVHVFEIAVSDGTATVKAPLQIVVGPASEGGNSPVFRQPLGAGTTVDLARKRCVELPVVVEDPDTPGVTLAEEEPRIDGATLMQTSELAAIWTFCPTPEQAALQERYPLRLSADDGQSPKTLKDYLIVLLTRPKADCPGASPSVLHTPADATTYSDLTLSADVSDAEGMKYEPLVYYSTRPPADPPDISGMAQITMSLARGDLKSGTFEASIPNPVAGGPAGSTATLYYLILAQDNDDPSGPCDHVVRSPESGTYRMTVTAGGEQAGRGLCEPCDSDAQCGGPEDNCLTMGGRPHCFAACADDVDCPSGYYCSITEFTSVDGVEARQCIPVTYRCGGEEPPGCVDDAQEENDTRSAAESGPALAPGEYPEQASCDDDWYRIDVAEGARITASIEGAGPSADLDMTLTDEGGQILAASSGSTSTESVSLCLPPGDHYLRVYSFRGGVEPYALALSSELGGCVEACDDDPAEDDDDATHARPVDLAGGAFVSSQNTICADDDWYEVELARGQTLHATLTSASTDTDDDLDIRFYQGEVDLTGCTEDDPVGCSPSNGQSAGSNETFMYTAPAEGAYHLVVHGWAGSTGVYDLCISLDEGRCPPR